jgi:TRAP-type C4-dicarboxylate transport system substrate-binding protein
MRGTKLGNALRAAAAAVFVLIAGFNGTARAAEEPVVLKAITPWPMAYYWCAPMAMFQKMVNKRLKGKVAVSYLGANEVVSPFEQFEALRNGVVDVILGASSYYTGQVPEALAVLYSRLPPSKLRETGYYDIMRDLHMKKGNVVYLANVGGSPNSAFRFFTRDKIDAPDFTNMKIRVTPVYTELVKALGGTPITMKPSEVYTALERKVVDGYGWSYGGITDFAWQEVTGYVVDEPFFSANTSILINRDAWDKMPADVQAELEAIGIELEKAAEKAMAAYNAKEDVLLRGAGMNFVKFTDEQSAMFQKTAYAEAWKAYDAKFPELGPKLKALSE